VAAYLDILINRRIWNWRATDYSTMQYAMFGVMAGLRQKSADEAADSLLDRLAADAETFSGDTRFGLNQMNGPQVHRILARMTDFVETSSGEPSRYAEYAQRGRGGYEIEHIWANHPERHSDEFTHPADFQDYRNQLGGLLLLPKQFNASFGDAVYSTKVTHYYKHNLLAGSLNPLAYQHHPGFASFIRTSGLPFRAHQEFRKADVDERQQLYLQLARAIWAPERIKAAATS
jgi:hypothetical protein